jgi:hypothetical protein
MTIVASVSAVSWSGLVDANYMTVSMYLVLIIMLQYDLLFINISIK